MSEPLPPYNFLWSDGCSLAPFFPLPMRKRFQSRMVKVVANDPELARRMRFACLIHDRAYYYGGTELMREIADRNLRDRWRDAGAPSWFCWLGYRAVRLWGGPCFKQAGVSWSYGGSRFRYEKDGQGV